MLLEENKEEFERLARASKTVHQLCIALNLPSTGRSYRIVRQRLNEVGIEIKPAKAGPKPRIDWAAVQKFHNAGNSVIATAKHFGIAKTSIYDAVAAGRMVTQDRRALPFGEHTGKQRRNSTALKRKLVRDGYLTYECSRCKLKEWRDEELILELDHIDGNAFNNNIENLRFLCPNCHSQTKTYCRRKDGKSQKEKIKKSNKVQPLYTT